MAPEMSPRQRWLAALRLEPVDRLPFWPKLSAAFPPAQSEPFRSMPLPAIHEWIGSDPHEHVPASFREVRTRTSTEVRTENGFQTTIWHTPYGDLGMRQQWNEPSQSWHPVEFPVKTAEDIKRVTAFYEDVRVEFSQEQQDKAEARAREIGQKASIAGAIGESPLMWWVEWLAGVENAHWLLADHQEEVEHLFDVMHRVLVRKAEIQCEHSPADMLYMVENTSTTLISPAQYRRYCFRHVGEYARIAASRNRNLVLHMCGHLKALLPDLAKVGARAFEAFTSPTLGNTTLLDGRTACPDVCLIGGTNAMLWTRPAREIIARIDADLAVLPHHRGLVVTSAGVMPPLCKAETIRTVCEWVKAYPARM